MLTDANRWKLDAVCRGDDVDPEVFFPYDSRNRRVRDERIRRARALCRRCPVRARCLDEADITDDHFAIMGGLTAQERGRRHRSGGRAAVHLASALVGNGGDPT